MNQKKIPPLPINPCLVKSDKDWLQFYPAGGSSSEFLKAVQAAKVHMGIHNLGLRNMVVTIDNQKAAPEIITSFNSFLKAPTINKAFMLQMELKGKALNVELKERNNNVEPNAVELSAENEIIDNEKTKKCFTNFEKTLTFKSKKTGKEVHAFSGSAPRDENGNPTINACEYQERHADVLIAHGIIAVCSYNEIKTENVKGQDILEKSKIFWQHMPVKDYQSPSVNEINRGWEILLDAIDNEGNIYIHCGAGLGRTGTAVTGLDILSGKFDK